MKPHEVLRPADYDPATNSTLHGETVYVVTNPEDYIHGDEQLRRLLHHYPEEVVTAAIESRPPEGWLSSRDQQEADREAFRLNPAVTQAQEAVRLEIAERVRAYSEAAIALLGQGDGYIDVHFEQSHADAIRNRCTLVTTFTPHTT